MLFLLLLFEFLLVLQELLLVLSGACSVNRSGATAGEFQQAEGGDHSLFVAPELDRNLSVSVDLLYRGIVILTVS